MRKRIAKKPKILTTKKKIISLVVTNRKLFNTRSESVWYSSWPEKFFTINGINYKYIVQYYARFPGIVNYIHIRKPNGFLRDGTINFSNLLSKAVRLLEQEIKDVIDQ